jgi:hypothetical protein
VRDEILDGFEEIEVRPLAVDTIADRLAAAEQLIADALNPSPDRPFDATIRRATFGQLAQIEHRIWDGEHRMNAAQVTLALSMIGRERHERACRDCRPS